jgi:hypothetical protein
MRELDINRLMNQLGISYEQYEKWLADHENSTKTSSEITSSGTRSFASQTLGHLVVSSAKKVLILN